MARAVTIDDASAADRAPGLSGHSSSAPVLALRPLEPPEVSPFGLDWMQWDPPEFELLRCKESRRRATKLLNESYRRAIQQLGVGDPIAEAARASWPATKARETASAGEEPEAAGWQRPDHHVAIYKRPPMPIPRSSSVPSTPAPPSRSSSASTWRQRQQQLAAAPAASPLPAPLIALDGGRIRKKEAIWNAHSSMYTFGQVFEEIDARVHHREPRDTRTVPGRLGPLELGPSATRAPRALPQIRRR